MNHIHKQCLNILIAVICEILRYFHNEDAKKDAYSEGEKVVK